MTAGPPDRIDILSGSRVVRVGRTWRAELHVRVGQRQTFAHATHESPGEASAAAVGLAWLGILHAAATARTPPA